MPLFRSQASFLGIDIGTSFVKAVQLTATKGERFRLDTFGSAPLANSLIRANSAAALDDVAKNLSEVLERINVNTKNVIAGMPGFASFTALVELPLLSDEELGFALKTEASKYVPTSLDQMVLDWKVVDRGDGSTPETSKMRVLLIAILKEYVEKYATIFEKANLNLVAVELNAIASCRALVGAVTDPVLVMDMGGNTTDLSVSYRGGLWLTKTVEIGGETFTKTIAKSLNIDSERAEQFKRDADFDFSPEQIQTEHLPRVLRPLVDQIVAEVKRALDIFALSAKRQVVEIVMTGGSSSLRNIDKLLAAQLGIPNVRIGDPWSQIDRDQSVIDLTTTIGSSFSTAIGLAMRRSA